MNAMCPKEYYFDFMTWLCEVSGACAVWNNHIEKYELTECQIMALNALKDNGLYKGKA